MKLLSINRRNNNGSELIINIVVTITTPKKKKRKKLMNTNDTEKLISRVMGMLINAVIFLTEWHLAMGILPLRRLCCGRIKLGDCEQQKSKRCLRETKFCDGDVLATHRRRKNTMRCFRETHPWKNNSVYQDAYAITRDKRVVFQ